MNDLDGEITNVEVITKVPNSIPYDAERYLDRDNFYPMNGEVIPMVAANAGQNTGNYFDQDNFYPADGVKVDQDGGVTDVEFSDAFGDAFRNLGKFYRNTTKAMADYMSPKERAQRKKSRDEKRKAKIEETKSRSELNKSLGQDKGSDVALAQALQTSAKDATSTVGKKPMSTTTKVLIGVGAVAVIGLVTFLVLRKKK